MVRCQNIYHLQPFARLRANPGQPNKTPGLLEEGILPTLRDAKARLLSPGYVSVPHSAEVWAFCCESSEFHSMSRLLPQAVESSGEAFLLPSSEKWERCPGTASPVSVRARFRPLSPSVNVFDFNFSAHGNPLPGPEGRKRRVRFPIDGGGGGTVHAVVCWWRCFMDKDRTVTMSTFPLPPPKEPLLDKDAPPGETGASPAEQTAPAAAPSDRDHWRQSVYLLSRPVKVRAGDAVCALAHHDDTTVWFHAVERETQSTNPDLDAIAASASCGAPSTSAAAADAATTASLRPASAGPASAVSDEIVRPTPEDEAATAPPRRKPAGEEEHVLPREIAARAPKGAPVAPPACVCGLHRTCPPSRIWMLNDQSRAASFRSVIRSIVVGVAGPHLARGASEKQQRIGMASTAAAAAAIAAGIRKRRTAPVPKCVVACISDGFLLPLLAAQEGASEVLEIQPSAAYGAVCRDVYQANGIDVGTDIDGTGGTDRNNQNRRIIRPFPGGVSSVYELLVPPPGPSGPPDDENGFSSAGRKLDAVIGEPFFADLSTAAWPLESLLLFWCARTALEAGGHFSPRTRVVPARARLLACPFACDLLFRGRRPVGIVEGVDMSAVNHRLGLGCAVKTARGPGDGGEDGNDDVKEGVKKTGSLGGVESVRLSEYGHELLGLPTEILDIDLTQPLCDLRGGRKKVRCRGGPPPSAPEAAGAPEPAPQQRQQEAGGVVCHGVVLWLDIWLDEEGSHRLSTGPEVPYWPQGVLFFGEGWVVPSCGRSFHLEAALEDGALSVGVS